jgi:hypothetical protein
LSRALKPYCFGGVVLSLREGGERFETASNG